MKRKRLIVATLLFLTMLLWQSSSILAANRIDIIYRDQTKGWLVAPGDDVVVYYVADGHQATAQWYQGWWMWLMGNSPNYFFRVYCAARPNGPWYQFYSSAIFPWRRELPLYFYNGFYKFEIIAQEVPSMGGGGESQVNSVFLRIY